MKINLSLGKKWYTKNCQVNEEVDLTANEGSFDTSIFSFRTRMELGEGER